MLHSVAEHVSLHNSANLLKSKKENAFKIGAIFCYAVFVTIQLILIFTFHGRQVSDAEVYLDLAKSAAQNNQWYPSGDLFGVKYFAANGYINLLALILRFTDNLKILYFLNFIFNHIQLLSGCYIAKKVFKNSNCSYLFAIVFCLFPAFWGEVVQLRTETMFTALAYLAVAVSFSKLKLKPVLCGILLAAGNFVRPMAIIFILAVFAVFYINRERKCVYVYLLSAFLAVTLLFGYISYVSCGHFVFQPTTSGINLIIGANDDADGSYDDIVFTEGHLGYLSEEEQANMIFKDYDSFYKTKAIGWIFDHPIKYISLIPKKLFYLYATDLYSCCSFSSNETATDGADYLKMLLLKIKNRDGLTLTDLVCIYSQVFYMIIMVLFAAGFYAAVKTRRRWMIPIYLIFVLGTAMTVLIVGSGRYHYPFLPAIFMNVVLAVSFFTSSKEENN